MILLCLFAGTLSFAGEISPRALHGTLDLRDMNFDSSLGECSGEWAFYPGSFIVSGSLPATPPLYKQVPGPWNHKPDPYPAKGFGTYRLTVLLPHEGEYALEISELASSYRLYINGQLIGGEGRVSGAPGNYKWLLGSRWYLLQGNTRKMDIVIESANWNYRDGGLLASPRIGRIELLIKSRESKSFFDMFLLGALIVIGLYHMGHYLLYRKERASHYIGFFSLLIGMRIFVVEKIFVSQYLGFLPYEWICKLDALTIFLGISAFITYLHLYFENIVPKPWSHILVVPGYLFALIALVFPASWYSMLMETFFIFLYAAGVYSLWFVIAAVRRKRTGAWVTLAGSILLLILVVNDSLNGQHLIHTTQLVPLGMFMFMFGQTTMQLVRFTKIYRATENFSKELEQKVIDRTSDLERDQKKLLLQNRMMLEELRLAQRIQKQYIPKKSPSSKVAFYYKPMEQLGGDFFDFVELADGRLGLFLSDVSGHGVPAAFVTSMIKSFMLQYRDLITDPAELLIALNDFLFQFTGGQFVTAFYGIFDPKNRSFIYANAGHHSPYLIREGAPWYLSHEFRGLPIAVLFHQDDLERKNQYRNMFIELPENSKLFLFTDGLTEAVNINERQCLPENMVTDFETRELTGIMIELADVSASDFIDEMINRLVAFRGSTEFDDDVCMICMEVD